MKRTNILRSTQGFTLVELAIVLVIIGLIVGGVLKGRELITQSKVTNIVTLAKSIQAAVEQFKYSKGANPFGTATAAVTVDFFTSLNTANLLTLGPAPTHKLGGNIDAIKVTAGYGGLTGSAVVFRGIPGKLATAIDKELDDGTFSTGDVISIKGTASATSTLSATNDPAVPANAEENFDVVYFIK